MHFEVWYNFIVNNRDYKDFSKGEIYHIYNRGVGKMDIFQDDEDLTFFLYRLKENLFPESVKKRSRSATYRRKPLPSNSFDLVSYCLMPNHFHLLIQQKTDLPITQLLLKICTGYSKYFNKKYDRVGAVFQDRSKAVRIEKNEQLLWTSFYIHNNPKKAGLVTDLSDYKWGSYLDYVGLREGTLCKKDIIFGQFNFSKSYFKYFDDLDSNEIDNNLVGHQDLLIDLE